MGDLSRSAENNDTAVSGPSSSRTTSEVAWVSRSAENHDPAVDTPSRTTSEVAWAEASRSAENNIPTGERRRSTDDTLVSEASA